MKEIIYEISHWMLVKWIFLTVTSDKFARMFEIKSIVFSIQHVNLHIPKTKDGELKYNINFIYHIFKFDNVFLF